MSVDKIRVSSHMSRWLISIAILPPVLYIILADKPMLFLGLTMTGGGFLWWEYFNNLLGRERLGLFSVALLGWGGVSVGVTFFGPQGLLGGLLLVLFLGAGYTLAKLPHTTGPVLLNLLGRYALGHLYLSLGFSFMLLLRQRTDGAQWVLYALLVTIVSEKAEFYVGRHLKGPKLYPAVSPNKTISGLLGGVAGALLISVISALSYLPSEAHWLTMGFFGVLLCLLGAFGDLFESALKRALDLKDTSHLLMGHGGFMDRLDSFLFIVGPTYLMVTIWMGL